MPVTTTTLRLQQQLAAQLTATTDAQVNALTSAWADAWDEVAADLETTLVDLLAAGGRITRTQILRATRLRTVLGAIGRNLDTLAHDAGIRIIGDLAQVVEDAGARQAAIVASQLPERSDLVNADAWTRVEDKTIRAIVTRSTHQITSRTQPLGLEADAAVRRELIRGIAAGSNPRATARRMVARTEGRFNGGLTRALVIARTETLDAHRAAAAEGQAQHADVLTGWAWLAKLDARTCRSCWAQHGTVHALDEPGPLDHQQGRCARMPKTMSWADLGIDLDEPADQMPDAAAVFATLTPAEQAAILGRKGHAAWLRGEFPMDAWSKRRRTPGWRDSYGVASPSGGRGTRAAA